MTIRRPAADVVQFTRESAERIAEVVRDAEGTPLPGSPLRFSREIELRNPKVFRIATYAGPWGVGQTKTVTFKYVANTPNTANVLNLFFPLSDAYPGDCAIAREGTSWFLIDVPLHTATAIFARETQTLSYIEGGDAISLEATLNTNDCTITLSKSVTASTAMLLTNTFQAQFISLEPVES